VTATLISSDERPHRYRISFADGSIGSRYYDKPLRVGQQIVDRGTRHQISEIERQSEYGGIGRASAVDAPTAVVAQVAA
jgi:hypothetical protein